MVQALPTVEIKVCDSNDYTQPNSTKSYIYILDVKYNDELKQKTEKYQCFPEKTKANIDQFTDYQNEKKEKIQTKSEVDVEDNG